MPAKNHNPGSVRLAGAESARGRNAISDRNLYRALMVLPLIAAAPGLMLSAIAALAAPESIQIFRPVEKSQEVYLENDDGLLIVPGGRMFVFQVEISALNPLLEVRINGRRHSSPQTRWTFIKMPQFLRLGKNRILVEARTESGQAKQEFMIELKGLPGFNPKNPPSPKSPGSPKKTS